MTFPWFMAASPPRWISGLASTPASREHPQFAVPGHQRFGAVPGDQDHVLDLQTGKTEFVIWRLDADHHVRLEHITGVAGDVRRIIAFDADAVADMAAVVMRDAFLLNGVDDLPEQFGDLQAGPENLVGALHALVERIVIQPQF